jgi:hypothetical protein
MEINNLERRISTLESRNILMIRGYLVIFIVIIAALYYINSTHHNLVEITRESTAQRVITVEQRCELTMNIKEVLARDDPKRVKVFEKSYESCEKQLKKVKKIAKKAS